MPRSAKSVMRIHAVRGCGSWCVTEEGADEVRDEIVRLFGTATLPTPWRLTKPMLDVKAEIQRLNPEATIVLGNA